MIKYDQKLHTLCKSRTTINTICVNSNFKCLGIQNSKAICARYQIWVIKMMMRVTEDLADPDIWLIWLFGYLAACDKHARVGYP